MRLTISACLFIAMLLGLGACQRENTPEYGDATHPWDIGDDSIASGIPELGGNQDASDGDSSGEVAVPTLRGPILSQQDTLDTDQIPGLWIQVCRVRDEKMDLYPVEEMDLLQLTPENKAILTIVSQGEIYQTIEGNWRKAAPGKFGMSMGEYDEKVSFAEMYGPNFLYIWDYDIQLGVWYARAQQNASNQIEANLFDTSRGMLHFTNVVGNSYQGYLDSAHKNDLRGMYVGGILTMRWEDQKGKLGGFAAFIVDPGWETLDGVWWIDDYEAAPFGGPWTGTRMAGENPAPAE